jgi:hypothetical protein
MGIFDTEDVVEGKWFPYFESIEKEDGTIEFFDPKTNDDGEFIGRVCIRQHTMESLEEIEDSTSTEKGEYVYNKITRKMEYAERKIQTKEQKKQNRLMLWDYTIVDWDGEYFMHNGTKIPVTIENKMKMMNMTKFSRFVIQCLGLLNGQTEVTEKN